MAARSVKCLRRPNWKHCLWFLLAFSVFGIIFFGYFCFGSNCALRGNTNSLYKNNYDAYFAGRFLQNQFAPNELDREYSVDIDKQDVVVFLHIQKTGGTTFGRHLVDNLRVDPPCNCLLPMKKHCECLTKNRTVGNRVWLFSRYTTGWTCGLHADWTELKECVDDWFQRKYGRKKRRYLYITILRDPVPRFLSEWMHVQRGATWKSAKLRCNGRAATLEEVPFCHEEDDWSGVSLQTFMACKHNLAFNRQTRMAANLSKVNCYNTSGLSPEDRSRRLLESAKENLVDMAFFGLMEYQPYTQFLFEHTLHMTFIKDFQQYNSTHVSRYNVSEEDMRAIARLNQLDIELYQFAKDLFLQRVRQAYVDRSLPIPEDLEKEIALAVNKGGVKGVAYTRQPRPMDNSFDEVEYKNIAPSDLDRSNDVQVEERGDNNADSEVTRADGIVGDIFVERQAFPSASNTEADDRESRYDNNMVHQTDISKPITGHKARKDLPGLLGIDFDQALDPSLKNSADDAGGMPRFDSVKTFGQKLKGYR